MENIQIHSVLVLNLLLNSRISYTVYVIPTEFADFRQQSSNVIYHTNYVQFGPEAFQISSWFSYKEFFLCHVPSSQQVQGTHANIVVMIKLDTSINT